MRVLQYAKRSVTALVIAALAGCGGDSTAPDAPFDPAGTSSDVNAMGSSFESPAMESYAYAVADISLLLGSSTAAAALKAAPSADLVRGGKAGAARYAASLARAYLPAGIRPSLATAGIPAEYLGATFVYDIETDGYVASELTGAPANGVRFLLYAVNPITNQPIEPLVEVGYADVVATETATSASVSIEVVSGGVTFLDYTVAVGGTASAVTLTVSGYATNGTDRVNFDLDTTLTNDALVVDYLLVVPTRGGFRIDLEADLTGYNTSTPSTTLNMEARGPHGTVSISGNVTDASGSFEVEVNGDLFATITLTGSGDAVITGAGGEPLTPQEQEALVDVFEVFGGGLEFYGELLEPLT